MANAYIGLQPNQHAFAASSLANGFEDIGLAAEAEYFLVVHACAYGELFFQVRH